MMVLRWKEIPIRLPPSFSRQYKIYRTFMEIHSLFGKTMTLIHFQQCLNLFLVTFSYKFVYLPANYVSVLMKLEKLLQLGGIN